MIRFFSSLALLTLIVGCAAGAPPNAFERNFYNVITQRHEVVVLRTNVTPTATNVVLVPGFIEIPFLDPKPVVTDTITTAASIATTSGVGWAGILGALLASAYGGWATYQNNRKAKLAGALGQNVQTLREVIKSQPNGAALDAKAVAEISAQQVDSDVKKAAAKVRDEKVNTVAAKEAAARVMA